MQAKFQSVALITGLALGCAGAAAVDESDASAKAVPVKSAFQRYLEQDYMLGTWGGLRTELSKHGVDFEFFYIASNPRNISGGIKTGSDYQGAFLMVLDLDSQKLAGYEGGHFHVGGVSLHGEDHFSDRRIGDLNKVNLIDFPNAWRLWELWYEQQFWNNRLSLKLGQMAVDQDFLIAEYYNSLASINLLNQTFFYPTLAFNIYNIPGFPGPLHALPSSPYGAPAARLKLNLTDQVYAQVGIYDGYPNQENGLTVKLNKDQGALVYAEAGWRRNQKPESLGPPGNIKLGFYYDTGDYPDNLSVARAQLGLGNVSFHPNSYGAYLLIDQYLFREIGKQDPAQQGLVGFFRLTGAPADRNLTQFGVDGGLVYKGLIPTRDWDSIAFGVSYLQISDDIRKGQRLINSAAPGTFPELADYEGAIELSYKAQITAWMTLHVSVERAIHPGGHTSAGRPNPADAWAFILASTLRF